MSTGPLDLEAEIRPDNGDTGAVVVDNLRKIYGELVAVNASFAITEGEIFGILGPNGAGRAPRSSASSGEASPMLAPCACLGPGPTQGPQRASRHCGRAAPGQRTPRSVEGGRDSRTCSSRSTETMPTSTRSSKPCALTTTSRSTTGRSRAVSSSGPPIALALIGGPKIVLDEMTTGLDPQARRDTWELIEAVRDRGVTVLLVIHYMDEAERLCNRVALFDQVRVVAIDTPEGLAGRAGVEKRVRFVPSRPFDDNLLTQSPTSPARTRRGPRRL